MDEPFAGGTLVDRAAVTGVESRCALRACSSCDVRERRGPPGPLLPVQITATTNTAVSRAPRTDMSRHKANQRVTEDFVALPSFTFSAEQQAELAQCAANETSLIRHQRDVLGDADPLDTWLHGVARVRDQMAGLEYLIAAREALTGTETALTAWQLPHVLDAHWVGAAYPADHAIDGDRLLLQVHRATPFAPAAAQAGLLLDEWTEVIPTEEITTGVAFHFDQPNSEPPQAFLRMTPTNFRGGWVWRDIIDGLHETLDAAKRRAVEPEHIDETPYALLVPATIASTLHHPLSIALNYAVVNSYTRVLAEEIV